MIGFCQYIHRAIIIAQHILGTRFQCGLHDLVLVAAARVTQDTGLGELVGHRAIGTKVTTSLGKGMAHLGNGTIAVVGNAVHHHRNTTGPVALVARLLKILTVLRTRTALDRAFNGVLGHVATKCLVNRQPQTRVAGRVRITHLCRHGDLADQLGKQLATLGILGTFTVLNIGPFTVSCHGHSPRRTN